MRKLKLTPRENRVIAECLNAAASGPFLPDGGFHALIGLSREELRQIAIAYPNVDSTRQDVQIAVNNSLNNLLYYPHHCEEAWAEYISVPRGIVKEIFEKWRQQIKRQASKLRSK